MSVIDQLYRERILDHYKRPRNFGVLDSPTVLQVEVNPSCGDTTTLTMQVDSSQSCIKNIMHDTTGCALSTAGMSILTEHVKGKTLAEVKALTADDMFSLVGVRPGPGRIKCVLLALTTLQQAIKKYEEEHASH